MKKLVTSFLHLDPSFLRKQESPVTNTPIPSFLERFPLRKEGQESPINNSMIFSPSLHEIPGQARNEEWGYSFISHFTSFISHFTSFLHLFPSFLERFPLRKEGQESPEE